MSEWASCSEELSRKALDVAQRAVVANTIEKTMTNNELLLVVNTLTDTISGLVTPDVLDTIYSIRKVFEL
jgi:hypothetical protein